VQKAPKSGRSGGGEQKEGRGKGGRDALRNRGHLGRSRRPEKGRLRCTTARKGTGSVPREKEIKGEEARSPGLVNNDELVRKGQASACLDFSARLGRSAESSKGQEIKAAKLEGGRRGESGEPARNPKFCGSVSGSVGIALGKGRCLSSAEARKQRKASMEGSGGEVL